MIGFLLATLHVIEYISYYKANINDYTITKDRPTLQNKGNRDLYKVKHIAFYISGKHNIN